mmetsp:Transcript_19530/g.29395  ORF Transcript_19530/g.29395 Transcript_19530/m.29395 type:complete len:126 (-) Transcript_19530:328-705(-)
MEGLYRCGAGKEEICVCLCSGWISDQIVYVSFVFRTQARSAGLAPFVARKMQTSPQNSTRSECLQHDVEDASWIFQHNQAHPKSQEISSGKKCQMAEDSRHNPIEYFVLFAAYEFYEFYYEAIVS